MLSCFTIDNLGGTERECEELRGSSVKQVVFGMGMVAYVLTNGRSESAVLNVSNCH